MSFDFRTFIKKTLLGMVSGGEPAYKIREKSAEWLDKGVITLDDVAEIDAAIEARDNPPVTVSEGEETVSETTEETATD